MQIADYKAQVEKDHKSGAVKKWFGLYVYFWWHTQFWLSPLDRRPYTFIFRDEVYQHPVRSGIIIFIVTSLLVWGTMKIPALGILDMLYGFLWGHLMWGSKYIPGEQEDPPIIDC
jgi:hypothetical protein